MAIRTIQTIGEEVLRKKAKSVEEITPKIITLLDDMVQTMYGLGVGLAAPQVGILKRVVVIDVGEGLIELINPEIIESKGEQEETEGCLSVPGKFGVVKRPAYVTVQATNRMGEIFTVSGTGMLAVCLCHELDHLDGILFVDKVIRYVDVDKD
ncbi:MAG: peptide deformylase [Hyphomonadaceae bacterium]|nr:peptide deformylase [Clostridia bacterium]